MGKWLKAARQVLLETFKPIRRTGDVLDIKETGGMILRWLAAPSLAVIAAFIQSHIPGIKNLYPWALPLMTFLFGFAFLILLTAVRFRLRITEYETPILEMWYEKLKPPNPFVHHFSPSGDILFRIAVKGPVGKTIDDVQVSLKQFQPQGAEFLPQALNPMSRDFKYTGSPTFRLNPGVPAYIDVIRWIPKFVEIGEILANFPQKAPRPVFTLMYFRSDLPRIIEHGKYQFILIAEGKDVPSSEQGIEIEFDTANKPLSLCQLLKW